MVYLSTYFNDLYAFILVAGISTESGIPDYRSKEVGLYARRKKQEENRSLMAKRYPSIYQIDTNFKMF